MTRPPFGFGPADRPDEPGGSDPFGLSALFGAGAGDVMRNLGSLLSWSGGPVNWDLATQVASAAAAESDPAVEEAERPATAEACRLADLWLDPMTTLPGAAAAAQAWTRGDWLTATLPAWRRLVDPVAGRVVGAMGTALEHGLQSGLGGAVPEEMRGLLAGAGPLQGMLTQIGGVVFGAQVGQALGGLSREVVDATDIGLPLSPTGRPALVPANIAALADGLDVPLDEVRLYVALRECAHQRLFAHVPWLGAHLFDAVDAYSRGIDIDPTAVERALSTIDPSDPESLQQALAGGLFELPPTPAQEAALARLETVLALVEGWVDTVVDAAAAAPLRSAPGLRETVRRRRASGGPAEQTFTTLVGLQLRPRRLREAGALWSAVTRERGVEQRDALWAHPDLLPGAEALDDPDGFARDEPGTPAAGGTDWDAELRGLDES